MSEKTYSELSKIAGFLQAKGGNAVSLNAAVAFLCAKAQGKTRQFWKELDQREETRGRHRVKKKRAQEKKHEARPLEMYH